MPTAALNPPPSAAPRPIPRSVHAAAWRRVRAAVAAHRLVAAVHTAAAHLTVRLVAAAAAAHLAALVAASAAAAAALAVTAVAVLLADVPAAKAAAEPEERAECVRRMARNGSMKPRRIQLGQERYAHHAGPAAGRQ